MTAITRKPHAGGRGALGEHHRKGIEATTQFYASARAAYSDPRREFLDAMHRAGIVPSDPSQIVADGRLCRFHASGDKHHTKNGWAVLFADGGRAAGVFGSWKIGATHKWHAGCDRLSRAEQARMDAVIEQARKQREHDQRQRHAEAQARAGKLWAQSKPADPQHGYLQCKGVPPLNLRQSFDTLLVPLIDAAGVLWNLQRISPDCSKVFLSGGRVVGTFAAIGEATPSGRLLICEGLATGATLHVETGSAVWCAMSCGNLLPVATAARQRFPNADITVCGDDDRQTTGNPGRTAATAAALHIGARVAFPAFGPDEDGSDFNDQMRNRWRAAP